MSGQTSGKQKQQSAAPYEIRARENLITSVTVVLDGSTILRGRVVWDNEHAGQMHDLQVYRKSCGFRAGGFVQNGERGGVGREDSIILNRARHATEQQPQK